MIEHEVAGEFDPIEKRDDIPWASILPDAQVLHSPDLWKAILDPECKNKGRMITVLYEALAMDGRFGNNCPQEARDKVKSMML